MTYSLSPSQRELSSAFFETIKGEGIGPDFFQFQNRATPQFREELKKRILLGYHPIEIWQDAYQLTDDDVAGIFRQSDPDFSTQTYMSMLRHPEGKFTGLSARQVLDFCEYIQLPVSELTPLDVVPEFSMPQAILEANLECVRQRTYDCLLSRVAIRNEGKRYSSLIRKVDPGNFYLNSTKVCDTLFDEGYVERAARTIDEYHTGNVCTYANVGPLAIEFLMEDHDGVMRDSLGRCSEIMKNMSDMRHTVMNMIDVAYDCMGPDAKTKMIADLFGQDRSWQREDLYAFFAERTKDLLPYQRPPHADTQQIVETLREYGVLKNAANMIQRECDLNGMDQKIYAEVGDWLHTPEAEFTRSIIVNRYLIQKFEREQVLLAPVHAGFELR